MADNKQITTEQLKDIGKVQKLNLTEKACIEAFGEHRIKRRYRKDGGYSWSMPFKPNEGGKLTKDASKLWEMYKPFVRADTERHARLQSEVARVALKDEAGSVQFVAAEQQEQVERNNGWRRHGHRIKVAREDRRYSLRCRHCGELPYWCEC